MKAKTNLTAKKRINPYDLNEVSKEIKKYRKKKLEQVEDIYKDPYDCGILRLTNKR